MENREAIASLKTLCNTCTMFPKCVNNKPECFQAIEMAISALEKQEADREAIPHRNYKYLSDYWCECGWHLGKKGDVKFCSDCGKRIKWD